ncbi:hypothetical protein ACW2Q0_11540 [Nocardia sp. R16R-3T]
MSRFVLTIIGALVAVALTVGFASTASAAPGESAEPTAPVATEPIAAAAEPAPQATLIGQCLAPGDTIEVRTLAGGLLGAAIGGIAGLPIFFVGAIPGLVIGGLLGVLVGSTSYAVDEGHLQQQGLC